MIDNFPHIHDLSAIAGDFLVTDESVQPFFDDLNQGHDLRYIFSSRIEDGRIKIVNPNNVSFTLQPRVFKLSNVVELVPAQV